MPTECLYFLFSQLSAQAQILEIGTDDKGPFIVCDKTIFHAQGGGQKSDQGTIDGIAVTNVVKRGTPQEFDVVHYLATPSSKSPGQSVEMQVNGEIRQMHSRLHSLGHLLAHIVDENYPALKAVQGHHWPHECRVEFLISDPAAANIDETQINTWLTDAITADLPIISQFDTATGRLVQIGNFTPVGCGGTHLTTTGLLQTGQTRGAKVKGDRLKISYE